MAEIIDKAIDGIRFLVEQIVKDAPYDKTDTAIVKGTTEFGYSILYNGKVYNNIKTIGGSCYTNETVRIMIPQNNMGNMFILKAPEAEKYYSLVKDNQIPDMAHNANLNDYKTPGNYYCSWNEIAKTLVNAPGGIVSGWGTSFSMKVEYILGHGGYVSQTLITYNEGNRYYRFLDVASGVWSAWRVSATVAE